MPCLLIYFLNKQSLSFRPDKKQDYLYSNDFLLKIMIKRIREPEKMNDGDLIIAVSKKRTHDPQTIMGTYQKDEEPIDFSINPFLTISTPYSIAEKISVNRKPSKQIYDHLQACGKPLQSLVVSFEAVYLYKL